MLRDDGTYRKLRKSHNEPGTAHELTFSCYRRMALLSKERTRQWFVDALHAARQSQPFGIWAYVIMPEHAHVLIYPTADEYDVGRILQAVKQPVAKRAINWLIRERDPFLQRLASRPGDPTSAHHFWQPGGGYDRDGVKPKTLREMVEYIHMNPVRRKLVEKMTDWVWSSARWYEGEADVKLAMDGKPPRPPLT